MMQGYGYGNMMGWGWGIIAAVFWLLVIAGVVVLVVWGIRQLSGNAHGHKTPGQGYYAEQPRGDQACEIARVRYAKGEITREQYAEICQGLGVPGPPPGGVVPPGTMPPGSPRVGSAVWVPPAVAQPYPQQPPAGQGPPPPQQPPQPPQQPPQPTPPPESGTS
jgi:uncharacterized membrane protein